MTDGITDPDAALVTMGADESGLPLAAIYRTRFGRMLNPHEGEAEPVSTKEDSRISSVESVGNSGYDIEFDDITPLPEIELYAEVAEGAASLASILEDNADLGSDPRILTEAIRIFAAGRTDMDDSEHAWYRTAFTADTFLTRPPIISKASKIEARFVASTLGLANGSRILDVGCGYGRLTNHLANSGYKMVGLDLSQDILKKAQSISTAKAVTVEYVWGDMRLMEYAGEFDGLICTDTSFGYFSDAENLLTLRAMARALRPGGRMVIDVLSRQRALAEVPGRSWWEGRGCLIQEDSEFDQINSRLNTKRLMVFSDGRQMESLISIRMYTAHELVALCRIVGLQLVELSGSPHEQGAYFSSSSRRLVITVQRLS